MQAIIFYFRIYHHKKAYLRVFFCHFRNSYLLEAIKPYAPTHQITVDLFISGDAHGHGNKLF